MGQNRIAATPERLREAMTEAGKKQIDLARETGVSHSSISRYLSGLLEPRQDAMYKLAKALDVSEMWLWGYDVPKGRTPGQKENDALASVVVRLRTDAAFREAVLGLNELSAEKLQIVTPLLRAF